MTESNIVPECYVDTKLAEILSEAPRKYNHQHGHGNVANKMKFDLKDEVALGIIDEDTIKVRKAKYFSEFHDIKNENNLILKKHYALEQYLIIISPEIEKWLMNNAEVINIEPENFGLPKQLKGFVQISKIKDIDKNIDFYRFIKELIKNNAPGIITLKTWIEAFKTNTIREIK